VKRQFQDLSQTQELLSPVGLLKVAEAQLGHWVADSWLLCTAVVSAVVAVLLVEVAAGMLK